MKDCQVDTKVFFFNPFLIEAELGEDKDCNGIQISLYKRGESSEDWDGRKEIYPTKIWVSPEAQIPRRPDNSTVKGLSTYGSIESGRGIELFTARVFRSRGDRTKDLRGHCSFVRGG